MHRLPGVEHRGVRTGILFPTGVFSRKQQVEEALIKPGLTRSKRRNGYGLILVGDYQALVGSVMIASDA